MSDHRARVIAHGEAGFGELVKRHAERFGVHLIGTVEATTDTSWWGGTKVSESVRFAARSEDAEKLADFLHVIGAR